ncbi:MAG: hypothetical protein JHD02_10920 [Thermoleophilaceae bacterium]|nr:hypothetical protein [Thermoleophilaceae bacterium]
MIQPSGGSATDAPKAPMTANQRYARIALWLGVISIFVFQVVLGPIAVAMGVISYRRGEKKEGRLAIIFGCIGILLGIAALILVETGVIPSTEESWERIRELLRGEGQ